MKSTCFFTLDNLLYGNKAKSSFPGNPACFLIFKRTAVGKIKWIIAAVLLLFLLSPVAAQTVTGESVVKGMVRDSASQKPLDFVTVTLKDSANRAIKTTLTKADGSFRLEKLAAGKYVVGLVSVSYKSKTLAVDILDKSNPTMDLGHIDLAIQQTQLSEVSITADKPIIKQEVDRITYDLQADPESKVNSVLEMMRKVPLLSLDGEENILLKGNANYKILINGKPSSMMERNPKNILRSMPASTIQRIEVITTPPAKYDGEGLAGIINIITHTKIDNGYNGSVNLNERFPVGGPGAGLNFTVRQGKFGIAVMGGGNVHSSPQTSSLTNRITTGANASNLIQNGAKESANRSGYLGTELSYEMDTLNLISGQFNINGDKSDGESNQLSQLSAQDGFLQGYHLINNHNGKGNGMDATLNYQLGFKAHKSRLLTFSYRYFQFRNDQFSSLEIQDRLNYDRPDFRQHNIGSADEQTFQIDYVWPVKKLIIEAGLKGILRINKSDFQYLSYRENSGQFELDPGQTNRFHNTQDVYGAYNTYQFALKNWEFKGGVRVEETRIDADFLSGSAQVKRSYFNLIPSVSINRKLKENTGLNIGYALRIQRPSIYQLNPFVDRSNPSFESAGNPDLKPVLADNITIGYNSSKKVPVNLLINYLSFRDLIMSAIAYDPSTNITRTSYQNTGKARLLGVNFNMNYNFTKKWNLSVNGNIAHGWVEGFVNGVPVENHGFMEYASLSTGYKFEKGWRLNGNFFMNGPYLSLQATTNWNINTSFSVNKDLVKDKLTFSTSFNNPFAKFRNYQGESFGPDFNQLNTSQNYYRSCNVSLNYNFGKLKEGLKKNKRGISNDDVSNKQ